MQNFDTDACMKATTLLTKKEAVGKNTYGLYDNYVLKIGDGWN
jgi:hypothetical protein